MNSMKDQDCFHCGESVGVVDISVSDKQFCCQGCKVVFEILSGNDLDFYYDIETSPGSKMSKEEIKHKYAFLDNREIQQKLLSFTDGQMSRVKLFFPQIHCSSCIWLLENLQRLNSGIINSEVNFVKKEVSFSFDETAVSLKGLVELLASIGYPPTINLDSASKPKSKNLNKALIYKIGVAGFCFGNIMLLSFPEYLSAKGDFAKNYKHFFGYLNLLLALPVFFYCSSDYLKSAWSGIKHKYITIDIPISIGIITLFLRSAIEILSRTGAGYMDSLAGLLFFLLIGKWYQSKTYQALSFERDYKSYFPLAVIRFKEGKEDSVLVNELSVGDHIKIRNQEIIPADCILKSNNAYIDYSFVTGEEKEVRKEKGDFIYAGGKLSGSTIELEIEKGVSHSYLTQLWNQKAFSKKESRVVSVVDKASKYFTISVIGIALFTAVFWYFRDLHVMSDAFTSVLIVACPCALALTIPFTMGNTLRLFGRKGFYAKNATTIEHMASIDTVVFDKTGTLTDSREATVTYKGIALTDEQLSMVFSISHHSTHPLSKAINKSIDSIETEVEGFEEIPGKGVLGMIKGKKVVLGSESFVQEGTLKEEGSVSAVYIKIDNKILGHFEIKKPLRKGVSNLMKRISSDYEVHLLSGDNEGDRKLVEPLFGNNAKINFNQSPVEKLQYIERLQQEGKKVMMIGDGLNDAGALKQSDIGIAISDNVNNFSPSCDVILDAQRFERLLDYMKFSKISLKVVRWSFLFSILYNAVGVTFAVQGLLTPLIAAVLMPLSSVTVVGFITITINFFGKRKLNFN